MADEIGINKSFSFGRHENLKKKKMCIIADEIGSVFKAKT